MISIDEARRLILANLLDFDTEAVPVKKAVNRILAQAVPAPVSHPPFDQSAMDGYAFRYEDIRNQPLAVIGEVPAGGPPQLEIGPGQAARIFTGAQVPAGADTVVMQEWTRREGDQVFIETQPKAQANIRYEGEQIQAGQNALPAGYLLDAAAIGLLASLGLSTVSVKKQAGISLTVTGSEFAATPEDLQKGKIFESNGAMLCAALQRSGFDADYKICIDQKELLLERIRSESQKNDLLILTGGVSVGKYDYTRDCLEENGFEVIFHKVNQKPGKPLLFAKKGNVAAFGLPGNPRAVMIAWHQFVLPYIKASAGHSSPFPQSVHLPLAHDYKIRGGRTEILAGTFGPEGMSVLGGQGSHMLQSLSRADALLLLPIEAGEFKKGDIVEVHLLEK